jgi:hypothetical protein
MQTTLARIAEVQMGYSFRRKLHGANNGSLTVIQMKDIDDSNLLHSEGLLRVDLPELGARHLVQPGDLLFRSRGISNTAALVATELGCTVLSAPMLVIRPKHGAVDPAYLQWFINHPNTQKQLTSMSMGSAVKMISKAVLEKLPIELPTVEIQRQIVEIARLAVEEMRLTAKLTQLHKSHIEQILMYRAQETVGLSGLRMKND